MKNKVTLAPLFSLVVSVFIFFTAGCSHHPTRYEPEVGNANSVVSHGGVVYPVPASGETQVRMKLVSLPDPKNHTLHLRIYFKRVQQNERATLDPRAQILILPDNGAQLHPSRVYASHSKTPIVDLGAADQQMVELEYKLPAGGDDFPYFEVRWKVALAPGQSEAQTTRYNRDTRKYAESVAEQQTLAGDFPYGDILGIYDPAWIGPGFGWWPGDFFQY